MRTSLKILMSVVAVVAFGVIFWEFLTLREPRYQGKPLHLWLAEFDLAQTRQPDKAVDALRVIGTNALPLLARMICEKDALWKQSLLSFNDRQSYFQFHVTEARVIRFRAVEAYRILGSAAKTSVPALIQIMASEPSPGVRADVATALGWIGPDAGAAVPMLLQAAEDPNPQLRRSALSALANIRRWSPDTGLRFLIAP